KEEGRTLIFSTHNMPSVEEICDEIALIDRSHVVLSGDIHEVRRRPILTMLSGLAAGVAGALMYEKMSNGIFLESGGTSTDISAVRDGRVMARGGELGGHKLYLRSLDVRTLGVAGGSMIRVAEGKIADVGPRSAHIAGLSYEAFAAPLEAPGLELLAPCADDAPVFAALRGKDGRRVALTLAGAANLLGLVPEGDYARSENMGAVRVAWEVFGKALDVTAEEAARQVMELATGKVRAVVEGLIADYDLPRSAMSLAGGGGSAGVIVPYLGRAMNASWRIVKNAPIISTIGVALAMVRESVERTVANPSKEAVRSIRREAIERIMKSGAREGTVEVTVEVDAKANILRATAMGATEIKAGAHAAKTLAEDELHAIAVRSLDLSEAAVTKLAAVGRWYIFDGVRKERSLGVFHRRRHFLRVLDRGGVIRLRREGLGVAVTTKEKLASSLDVLLEETMEYGTVGGQLPALFAYYGEKQLDLSGLISREQLDEVLAIEMDGRAADDSIALLAVR
ncbi:MAG: hydantoinase/oxoprolinase family protein, partial [Negativicutes bacterium]